MRPRYSGPVVVISRNRGGAYVLCELNGSVFDRPVAVDAVTLVTKCTAKERGPSADNAVFYKGSSELKCKNCKVLNFTRCCTNCTSYSLKC